MKLTFLAIILFINSHPLLSQSLFDRDNVFLQAAPGLSMFIGNLDRVNYDKPYLSYALKGGAGLRIGSAFTAVLDYRVADYPRTDRPSVEGYTRNHTMSVYAQYTLFRWRTFEPYMLGGVGMTFFGTYDDPSRFLPAFGPILGGGVNIPLTDRMTLFMEGTLDVVLDDEAMDERSGRRGIDILGFFGAGIRFNLRPSSGVIRGVSVSAPRRVDAGESFVLEALFEGDTNGRITVRWDLGDGNIMTGRTVAHVYRLPGTYTVTVTAKNSHSQKETQMEIEVRSW